MIILDTNILSELMRPSPDQRVLDWVDEQGSSNLFITAITEAELRAGAAYLPAGRRKERLIAEIDHLITVDFSSRILAFESEATEAYAAIAADRRDVGRPISEADCLIAAIARTRTGPVTLSCRSGYSFKRPFVQKPRGFSSPMLSVSCADCKSH